MNLKQLSATLGLSQTTVSRALNGYPEVNETTRQKVLNAARTHDYSPNTRAKSLATGRAGAIGHVIESSGHTEIVNPIFGDFIAGAGEVYSANNFEMVLSVVSDDTEEQVYRNLKARGTVDGVVLHSPRMNDSRIALLHEIDLPFVVHGRASGLSAAYSWLDVNNREAFLRATEFLIDLGHRRIALINGLEEMDFAHCRRAGYVDGLRAGGIVVDPQLMRSAEMTEAYGHVCACDMLDQIDPPTAFLVSSIISALGVRRALEERGMQMGRDVSIVTYDDALSYLANGSDVPIFTATKSCVRDAGRLLSQMLLAQIADPQAAPVHHLLHADLAIGQSTGPPLPSLKPHCGATS